ncbi:hypothetical protein BH683_004180 [Williamsia sp. 1138]|uniref:hypothetical protein n=1 Tax=Williamsia sp. 1138 TaxID=1903117 RepID=UPI000A11AD71|nr:hypothetical protein [Williamsia sp. 1138]OZG30349.1 hypothetical protein BH683_004180 [Williamsia sp. 1138]
MPTITEHYGIAGHVDFLDIDVESDNRIYVDPCAIRVVGSNSVHAATAVDCLDTFFGTVASCAMSASAADRARGAGLLRQFAEPFETRLGMAESGFRGHGGASDVGAWIWSALTNDLNALLNLGVLGRLEELPLFIEGIGNDITSDITTRIVYSILVEFTNEMVLAHPEFTAGSNRVEAVRRQVWDVDRREWMIVTVNLPVVDDEPLLLVPTQWARRSTLMSAGRYYETTLLTYAQAEQAVYASDGKLHTTPKRLLKRQPGLERGRLTNLNVTYRAIANSDNLLAMFTRFVTRQLGNELAG